MAIGEMAYVNAVREQLLAGRARLADVLAGREKEHVDHLLNEVDAALRRIENGSFGTCEECHTDIGEDWLRENPLTTVCLEHMTEKQQRALEYDLEVAGQIQRGLLPPCDVAFAGWDICYHYQPAGVVSGDYCDLMSGSNGELHFVLADVSGKGVAAAMLSSNLRAVFRSLVPLALPTRELVARANGLFRESALPSQYATLVYGKLARSGDLEIVNAGHLPVLLATASGTKAFESTCHPLGLFDDGHFTVAKDRLSTGDTLVLYTDGISEAENDGGDEYGLERVHNVVDEHRMKCPSDLVGMCKGQLQAFRGRRERADDETILAIRYTPGMIAKPAVA